MNKSPVCFITVGSKEYSKYAIPFWRSMVKFHDPKDIDMIWYTNETDKTVLAKLPKGIKIVDLDPYLKDPQFYFRQKPVLMEPLLDEYELVVGFDSDSLILGSLDYILETKDYDCGTVINYNRWDEKVYPLVTIPGVAPIEYFNCSLVALRSKKFAHHWNVLCFSPQFDRLQFREQDLLNILCYYGNYNVRCFDIPDGVKKYAAWHGILAKGELVRTQLKGKEIIIPKGLGDTPFPPENITLKAISLGGGHGAIKDNWNAFFPADVMERVREIIA